MTKVKSALGKPQFNKFSKCNKDFGCHGNMQQKPQI